MAGDPSFRRALRYVRPYAGRLALVLLLSTSSTALSLVLPLLSRDLVDVALLGRDADALLRIIGIFAAITLVTFGVNAAAGLMYTRASAELLFDMRLDVYRHLQRLSPRFFARMPLGQIVSRINADIGEIQRVIGEAALAWLGHVVVLVGTIGFLVYLDWRLFLVSLAMVPPALWALVVYRRRLEVAVRRMRERSADIGTFLIESLRGIRVVVGFNAQEREARRFRRANDAFIDALMAMRKLTYLSGGLPGLLLAFGTSIVFLYGGSRVISGAMTMGTLVAFVTYQMRLLGPVQGLMGLYANLATARVSLHRVAEIFDAAPDVVESPTPVSIPVGEGDLEFRGVTVGFGRGGPVLDGVDLRVRPGETIAIVGRSGEGKSTIADLVTRHLDPDEGCILFDGTDLRSLRLDDVRRHIGVVEQEPFIFNTSLAENIRFSRPDALNDEVAAAARGAGLEALLDTMPEGLDTAVGEAGRALSAGERQRVAIARALLADPRVLVLDEATASLDPATEGAVISGYEAAMRGRTTLVITHRRAMAMRADRVVVLDRGRVVENGVPRDLAHGTGPFARLFPAEERA